MTSLIPVVIQIAIVIGILAGGALMVWAMIHFAEERVRAEEDAKDARRERDAIRIVRSTEKAESLAELADRSRRRRHDGVLSEEDPAVRDDSVPGAPGRGPDDAA